MSAFAEKIKDYYIRGMWHKNRIDKALELGKITTEEYNIIVNAV